MKKFFRIITLVLALITLLISANAASAMEIDSTNGSSEKSGNECFLEFPGEENVMDSYRKEICKRMNRSIMEYSFVTDEEYELLKDNGYDVIEEENLVLKYNKRHGSIQRFYFPVIYKTQNGIEMWYVDYDGEVRVEVITGKISSGYIWQERGNVHYNSNNDDQVLISCTYFAITYDNSTGCISVWEVGDNIRKHYVPANSIYAGKSDNEGFIFRNDSDVYAVRDYGCYTHEFGVRVIAHNVEFVISTDYEADDPDTYSQPLFFMKDGTVKCYCTFHTDRETTPDSVENLIDVRFENGFNL